jgi:hypothetical protein
MPTNGHMTPDQVSFYDDNLKKQIEGSYVVDGKTITVRSVAYGAKSARLDAFDHYEQALLARKLLKQLARDAAKDSVIHKGTLEEKAKKKTVMAEA